MIDLETANKFFFYKNGKLFWKLKKPNTRYKVGDEAGYIDAKKYKVIIINCQHLRAHKIIWLMHYGDWPNVIDHIDGNPSNNDIKNLRKITQAQNSMNRKVSKNNKSGVSGVYFCNTWKKWKAQITFYKTKINLGVFQNYEDAVNARLNAEKKHFGEFSRLLSKLPEPSNPDGLDKGLEGSCMA